MQRHERAKGYLLTALGVIWVSPDGLLNRFISADSLTTSFWRGLLYSLAMVLYLLLRYRSGFFEQYRKLPATLWLAAFFLAVCNVCFVYALSNTSVANALFMLSTTPVMAALLGWLVLRERVAWFTWLAIAAVVTGVWIISNGESAGVNTWHGDAVGLLAALTLAASFTVTRSHKEHDPIPIIAVSGFVAAALVWPFTDPMSFPIEEWPVIATIGLIILPLANILMFVGPKYLPATEVSLLLLLETVLGPIWVWWILQEYPGDQSLLGGAVVLTGLILNTVLGMRQERRR